MNHQFSRRTFLAATTFTGSVVGGSFVQGTATLSGRVVWEGRLPEVPAFRAGESPLAESRNRALRDWPNPMAPTIDAASRGMGGVLVHLEGIAAGGNPSIPGPVRLVAREGQIVLMQGKEPRQMGVVRPGESVEVVSEQERLQVVRARGAAFWAVPLVKRDQPTKRVCPKSGWADLSSGAGQYWARAHLWVTDTPFVTWTDATGRFQFDQVPAGGGNLTVVAHVPDWRLDKVDRDPESLEPSRADYRAPRSFEAAAIPGGATVVTVPAAAFSGR